MRFRKRESPTRCPRRYVHTPSFEVGWSLVTHVFTQDNPSPDDYVWLNPVVEGRIRCCPGFLDENQDSVAALGEAEEFEES